FTVGSTSAPPGAQIIIPVQVNGFSNVSTFQFSFHYDSNDAVLLDIGTFGLSSLVRGNFDTNQAINGILGISWDDPLGMSQTVPDGTTIFSVLLLLTGPIGAASAVQLDGSWIPVEISRQIGTNN